MYIYIIVEAGYVGTSSSHFPSDRPTSVINSIRPTATAPQETTFSTNSQTTYNERPSSTYSSSSVSEPSSLDQSSSTYTRPSSIDNPNPSNTYSLSTQYTVSSTNGQNRPQNKYPDQNTFSTDDRYLGKPATSYSGSTSDTHPYDNSFPTNQPTYSPLAATTGNEQYPSNDIHTYTSTTKNKYNFYHDIGPIYQYPMLYEHNYPQPNDNSNYPNVYAQNIPTIDGNYYRPTIASTFPTTSTTNVVASSSSGIYSPSSSYDNRPSQIMPTYMPTITTKPGGYSSANQGNGGYNQNPLLNSNGMTTGNENTYFSYGTSGNDKNQTMINGDGGNGETMYNSSNNVSHYNGDHNNHRFDIGNNHSNGEMRPIQTYFNPGDYLYEYTKREY